MGPESELPLPIDYGDESEYIGDLLQFVASSELLQLLCGGVHILDFFIRTPDFYGWLLPEAWRVWFGQQDLPDVLDLFFREDLTLLDTQDAGERLWREKRPPPASLVSYLSKIHSLSLRRDFRPSNISLNRETPTKDSVKSTIPRLVAVGMKEKKTHEVEHFARYVYRLIADVEACTGRAITHVVDFGSGQNYLGRTLASPPYNKHVIAVEGRHSNVEGAKAMDIRAKLAPKTGIWRNKKEWRAQQQRLNLQSEQRLNGNEPPKDRLPDTLDSKSYSIDASSTLNGVENPLDEPGIRTTVYEPAPGGGSINYVERRLQDGSLKSVIQDSISSNRLHSGASQSNKHLPQGDQPKPTDITSPNLMVISLHSCGNLTHHGLRSLTLNESVSAVALVGCCYNLLTERLTLPSYKLPNLRPAEETPESSSTYSSNPLAQVDRTPTSPDPTAEDMATDLSVGDPHGFPMSARVTASGISLNITARMMAVQAPHNWSKEDSARFFTRHFYRALLQKIFIDRGVVQAPADTKAMSPEELLADFVSGERSNAAALNWTDRGGATQPVIIGSLRKVCYRDFVSYVRGAVEKLSGPSGDQGIARLVRDRMASMEDAEIRAYAEAYAAREKDLSIVWSLMALSATLVEAVVVVDRWLWLREQMGVPDEDEEAGRRSKKSDEDAEQVDANANGRAMVKRAWVESVFDYRWSPRNLVVVGIKE